MNDELREALANYAHEAWLGWMQYMFGKGAFHVAGHYEDGCEAQIWTMPIYYVERWQRQMNTPYADLSDGEKESDRAEADKILALLPAQGASVPVAGMPDGETLGALVCDGTAFEVDE